MVSTLFVSLIYFNYSIFFCVDLKKAISCTSNVENNLYDEGIRNKILHLLMLGEGETLPGQDSQRAGNTVLLIKRHGRAWPGKEIRK